MRGRKKNTRSDSYSMVGQIGTCAPCRPPQSCLMPIPCYNDDLNRMNEKDMAGVIGPAWTRGEIEKPTGLRDMGGWMANFYTPEQQQRLGVDENGNSITGSVDGGDTGLDIPKSCSTVVGGNCDSLDKWKMSTERCQDIGGDSVNPKSSTFYTKYGGCMGNKGTAGDISLCPGEGGKCALQNDQAQQNKIRAYYGKTDIYKVDENSQYYKDVSKIMKNALDMLEKNKACICSMLSQGIQPLASFDLDDTVWNTYGAMQLKFDQKKFDDAALASKFPPIQPVVDFIKKIREMGILPVFITGRASTPAVVNETLKEMDAFSKLTGLVRGYHYWYGDDVSGDNSNHPAYAPGRDNSEVVRSNGGIFMHDPADVEKAVGKGAPRPANQPDSGASGKSLAASLYKSTTRCWIQRNGLSGMKVHFVISVGDQWSDSNGRCSGVKVKLPNPMYYLP